MQITGLDRDDEPKVVELRNHPFFVGTAYHPEQRALEGMPHPLVSAFVQAVILHAS